MNSLFIYRRKPLYFLQVRPVPLPRHNPHLSLSHSVRLPWK